jgi:small GTP-binding protein
MKENNIKRDVLKLAIIGNSSVGKTTLRNVFLNVEFTEELLSTVGYNKEETKITLEDGNTIKLVIWDTAGQERFRSLAKIFYKDAKVICLVYDITSKKSFEELKNFWYEQQTKLNVDGEPIFAVVGNKYDLYETTQVDDEAKNFAKSIGAIFQYTSAKNASGITELFNNIGEKYFNPNLDINEQENKEKEIYEKKKLEKAQKKNENKNKGGVKLDSSIHQQKQAKKGCC